MNDIQKVLVPLWRFIKIEGRRAVEIARRALGYVRNIRLQKENFPNHAITSVRQQETYDWLCSIGRISQLRDTRLMMTGKRETILAK